MGQEFLDKYNLRDPLNRTLRYGVKQLFSVAGATTRQFKRVQGLRRADPAEVQRQGLLRPDSRRRAEDDRGDGRRVRRRDLAAGGARRRRSRDLPGGPVAKATELGITAINVPEDFDGIAAHRSTVTNVLVAEALAYGDMGLALPILAPGGVASALTHWGSADQQATYLKEFAGDNVPQACVAIAEPHPLFDPTALKTTAVRTPSGYRLDGVKSLGPGRRRRRIVHCRLRN